MSANLLDVETLKLSQIFNRCLIDLEAVGNFDLPSEVRDQAMQILSDTVDAALNVVNNSTMSEIDVEIGKLEDRVVVAAEAWREGKQGSSNYNPDEMYLARSVDALVAAREKAEATTLT